MDSSGPGIFLTIIAFIGGFSALVFIHEWGHYIVARIFNVKIDSFAIGFGKEIIGWTDRRGVRWKICMLPLGGYVKFFGDASGASNASDANEHLSGIEKRDCFHFKPVWQRMLITVAGPVINLLAAVLVFAGFYMFYGADIRPPVITSFSEDSPIANAGLATNDRILSVNGEDVERFSDIANIVRLLPGARVEFVFERDGEIMRRDVTLGVRFLEDRFDNKYPYGFMGAGWPPGERIQLGPVGALDEGLYQTGSVINTIFKTTGQILIGVRSAKELGGPLRIATMTGEAANRGLENLVLFLALISINLGIVNLLPIPVLDGGHLLFYTIEAIKGSPLNKKAQEAGFVGGMALLLVFMVLVTFNDLQSIVL